MGTKLDLRYVYEFQRERHQAIWDMPLPMRNDLKIREIENCWALPPKPHASRLWGLGGIVNAAGEAAPESFLKRGDNTLFGGTYEFDKTKCDNYEDEYIYLGLFISHWGHFLIDFCTRIYYAIKIRT